MNSPTTVPCSISAPAAAARSWCCCSPSGNCPIPTGRWWRSSAAGFRSRSTTSFSISNCNDANTQLEDRVAQRTRALMQANRRLSAQWLRLQRANGFKNEILGTVAHDLKNPLGVILGRTEMLTELIGSGSLQGQHHRAGRSYPRRHQAPDLDGRPSDFRRHGRRLRHHDPPRAGRYRGIGQRSRRSQPAVGREQAADHRGLGAAGPLHHVRSGPDARSDRQSGQQRHQVQPDRRQDRAAGDHDEDHTIIRVTDEGAGLSPEDLGRLFGRFQRLSAKPTAGESSTGLGLSIVKRIIDMHGGQITADSAGPGQGSTFTIILPAAAAS